MTLLRSLLVGLSAAWLCSCAATRPSAPPAHPTVLLVSIDGLRADALDWGLTPTLDALAKRGVRAEGMTPSYPSLTFPNHYSVVTGLRPDHHGIIHNTMYEAGLGTFKLSDRSAVSNAAWWGGIPIWVTAENAGITTATGSWPGSEAPIAGVMPSQGQPYDEKVPMQQRVAQALQWLIPSEGKRPGLVTLYFEQVDKAGHSYGPESAQYRAAIRSVDDALNQLMTGLKQEGLLEQLNVVVVSDHGMATVKQGNQVAAEDMVPPDVAAMVASGQSVGFEPLPGKQDAAYARLLGAHERYDCWKKEELPARWHYGTHPRVPSIICQMHEGWDALPRAVVANRGARERGSHGYDPVLPSMQAIFVAAGPAFKHDARLARFDNVDVYPLLARLLGVEPAPHNGNSEALLPALR